MRLSDYLDVQTVCVPLVAPDKNAAIAALVDRVSRTGAVHDRDRLLAAVLAREAQRTTAVGRGLAIPHAKCDCCNRFALSVGRPVEPLPFDALDGQPVRLIVLMACPPAEANLQIQMLARISRLLMNDDARARILAAPTAAELVATISAFEPP